MLSLTQYIYESSFNSSNWSHNGKYDYALEVITRLLNDENLKLGNNGDEGTISVAAFDRDKLLHIRNNITSSTVADFNSACKINNIWTKLYKGDFSGYNGVDRVNRGNAFETEFIKNFFTDYKDDLEKCYGKNIEVTGELINAGKNNTKRPLVCKNGDLITTPENVEEVGKYVTDVTIPTKEGDIYLSLKFGNTVTFINAGLNNSEGFPRKAFTDNDPSLFGEMGNAILKMFNIDAQNFIDVFNKYSPNNKKSPKTTVDVTDYINKDKSLLEFIKHIIGCDFILVHKTGSTTHYYSLLTKKDLDKFVGDSIKSCIIKYPNGSEKRVDITCVLETITINFNIRPKDGSTYPTHLMADYKFNK